MKYLKFRGWKSASLCLIISLLGIFLGFASTQSVFAVTKSRFEKLELFNKVLYLVESQYYRDVDTEKLIQGALNGMMDTLDPHSAFLAKDVFDKMQEDTQGEFGGLGIEVTQKDGVIVIITPIDDTPAFKAGLMPGDKIVEINHDSTLGITLEEAVDKMRGKPKTKIHLGIQREGVEGIKYFELVREVIKIKPVKSEVVDDNFIFIRLTQFQKRSASSIVSDIKRLKKKIERKKKKVKGVILDLRSNPGGLLDEAVDVSSIFLKDGIVVSTEGRDPKNKDIRFVKKTGHKELKLPMVVLINGASASASEIVAGALQDHKRAIVMGSQSFGKGSVQTVAKIDKERGVKLTIAQYMTPKGKKIQAIGITPDIVLDEVDAAWAEKNILETNFIRERDLRNHLTATIETKEEKKIREKAEKEERIKRIERIRRKREREKEGSDKKVKKSPERILKKYNPKEDFQVSQAVNYLKSFSIFKKMKK